MTYVTSSTLSSCYNRSQEYKQRLEGGAMAKPIMPEIDYERCNLCGDCIVRCPHGALSIAAQRIVLAEASCAYCGDCEDICPMGAIALPYEIVFQTVSDCGGGQDGTA